MDKTAAIRVGICLGIGIGIFIYMILIRSYNIRQERDEYKAKWEGTFEYQLVKATKVFQENIKSLVEFFESVREASVGATTTTDSDR